MERWATHLGAGVGNNFSTACVSPDGTTVFQKVGPDLRAFDTEEGQERWRTPLSGANQTPSITPDGKSLLHFAQEDFTVLSPEDGSILWKQKLGVVGSDGIHRPVVTRDGSRALVSAGSALAVIDLRTRRVELVAKPTDDDRFSQAPVLSADERSAILMDVRGTYFRADLDTQEMREVGRSGVASSWGAFSVSADGRVGFHANTSCTELCATPLEE